MKEWTDSMVEMWNKVKPDKDFNCPPFPDTGSMEYVGGLPDYRVPLKLKWDLSRNSLSIDEKPIRIIYNTEYAYKVTRQGLECSGLDRFLYFLLMDSVGGNCGLENFYYVALKKAQKVCKRAA